MIILEQIKAENQMNRQAQLFTKRRSNTPTCHGLWSHLRGIKTTNAEDLLGSLTVLALNLKSLADVSSPLMLMGFNAVLINQPESWNKLGPFNKP